jgi:hypothetical protein
MPRRSLGVQTSPPSARVPTPFSARSKPRSCEWGFSLLYSRSQDKFVCPEVSCSSGSQSNSDRRNLARFKGDAQEKFTNNDETFTRFDSKSWADTVKQLDEVMSDWEKAVEAADEEKLKSWYSTIAHVGAHNAYHIGQIIFVRKEQGSWDPEKGVKE